MEKIEEYKKRVWWPYLEEDLQKLIETSEFIYKVVKEWEKDLPGEKSEFNDYSFVVFPAAKAYEGFLKKLFLDLKFISEEDYYGKHFRIGKALNPSLPKEIIHESIYYKLDRYAKDKNLAETLWNTWKESRNLIFHWFPNEKNAITLTEAGSRVTMIIDSIDKAYDMLNFS